MSKIFWLVSYPKSGNTWLRALLTNYLKNQDAPANINELIGLPIASSRIWFDEWVGVEASMLDNELIANLRPAVYRCIAQELKETYFMKVHDAWSCTESGEALFPKDITAGVIYILRNPMDVAISYARFSGISIDRTVGNLCDPEFTIACSAKELDLQLPQHLSSWSGHIQSWVDKSQLPIYIVRYEDLVINTEKAFNSITQFCGLTYDAIRLQKAVSFSSFRELQKQEKEIGFLEYSSKTAIPFFRRGETNSWRNEMHPELARKLIEAHGETMQRFGYLEKV